MGAVEFEREVDVLCRGFLAAYGREALSAAVVAWLEQSAPAAQHVMEKVVFRLRSSFASRARNG